MEEEILNSLREPISILSEDILIMIFEYLCRSDRECVSFVCKRWLDIIDSNRLFQKQVLAINPSNYEEIFEEDTINRLISRGRFKNVFFQNVPYEEIIKMLTNKGPLVNYLRLECEEAILILKACAPFLTNLKSLEVYGVILGPMQFNREEPECEILDLNCLSNLREIKCGGTFTFCHFLSFTHPLERVGIEPIGNAIGPNHFLTILDKHAITIKSIYISSLYPRFQQKVLDWIKILNKMCCLEDLELNLPNVDEYNMALIEIFANQRWNTLKRISFDKVLTTGRKFLKKIALNCPNIRAVHLCGDVKSFGCDDLVIVLQHLTTLREFSIHSIQLTENSLCALAENLTNLRVLDLGPSAVSDRCMQEIYRHLINIRVLRLRYNSNCSLATVEGLVGISGEYSIQRLKYLNSLTLNGDNQNIDKAIDGLRFNDLRELYLKQCHLTSGSFKNLAANCPLIEKLILCRCEGVRGYSLLFKPEIKAFNRLITFENK